MSLIKIGNDGQKIVETNYWEHENAKKGFFYLSWNAGAARLLVPESQENMIIEMKTAKEVIISRGKLDGRDALELLFEDFTDSPFSIHIVAEQCDRLLPGSDAGADFKLAIWTREGLKVEFKGRYRVVDTLPCLNAWVD